MSRSIGNRLPAPMRFELGTGATAGGPDRCMLLATTDASGAVRVAVVATSEIEVQDERHLRFQPQADSITGENLRTRGHASLWYVLDGAAYTIQARAQANQGDEAVTLEIEAVLQDFRPDAPMVSGPTYRPPAGED